TDPNSHTTTTTASVICGVPGTSDTGCYEQSMVVDANGHEHATLVGGLGKTNYTQTYTGTSGSATLYATTITTYDAAGQLLSTKSPDGSTTTSVYDDLGHVISQSDPDRGATQLSYDPNGNLIELVDARGSAGTVFTGYDGLNRPLWQNSTNSPSGAWVTDTYDSTVNGNHGVGHLTGESFTGSGGLSGSYAYTYDSRGQQIGDTVTVNGTSYLVQASYNDAGQLISKTYPTGEVVTNGYDANGWLVSLNTQSGSTTTTLASNLTYTGLAGASGRVTTMDYGNGTIYTASYDTGMRLTSASLTQSSTNASLYQTQPAYDAANNVVSVATSITGSTDTQQFCYDSLNRLTWAGSTGTPPCASLTPGTLTAAQYQQSNSYNVENGLTSGPAGSYTYGDTNHPHAVTATSSGYSAAYDAAGNMICRAPSSATTCSSSSPTGQKLSYDPAGRLSSWQNQPGSPRSTANYLYDGSGNRVAMLTNVNGTTTLTAYIGSLEDVQITGGTATTTTYYAVGSMRIAAKVNGTFYYFGYDALGSQVVVLNNSGNVVGSQLYGPYGNSRYSAGTLPTSIGFTGQQADNVTGLDYYVARYYDPVIGQFLSADIAQGNAQGTSPYAYVGGNPETRTDPTGQRWIGPNGETAWVNPGNGNIYVEQPGSLPKVVGHVNVRPPAPPPPRHPNPKFVPGSSGSDNGNQGGCNDACETDKILIESYLQKQETYWQNVATAIGDGIALASDVFALVLELLASDWKDVVLESISIVSRVAALVGDLAKIGVFSMPAWVSSALQAIKWAANAVDAFGALLNLLNPLAPVEDELKQVAWWMKPKLISFILSTATLASAGGTVAASKVMDASYWGKQISAVDSFDYGQAHSACLQDYASDPVMCQ
ncbi:MAG TPA: RHS repeat-associated core domain-containing protein, partial [Ktedonobacteraceae bacterium]|nr:RHS repeat-associated core domain-containing protein [Ktedonobacteraceae bacterium]